MLPLPLYLYRVLDLTTSVAGASASRMLADLGAEVIVVERQGTAREVIDLYGRNKFSCIIDAFSEQGRELILAMATTCHVVIRDAEDEALRRLDYEAFRERSEDIVLVRIGEGRERPGIGNVAAAAAMTALFNVRFNGEGQQVDVAFRQATVSMRTAQVVTASAGASSLTPDLAISGCYACSDGSIAVAVRSMEQLAALGDVVGRPELADAVSGGDELREPLGAWSAGRAAHAAANELREAGIPAQAVLTLVQLREDPHLAARSVFEQVASDRGVVQTEGPRLRFSATPVHTRLPSPLPGEHTGQVLRDVAGLPEAEVESLFASGVVEGAQ